MRRKGFLNSTRWGEFHEKYVRMIRHIGALRGLTPSECDDLMIDVMVIFWKKVDRFVYDPERGRFRSYPGAIADLAALKIFGKN